MRKRKTQSGALQSPGSSSTSPGTMTRSAVCSGCATAPTSDRWPPSAADPSMRRRRSVPSWMVSPNGPAWLLPRRPTRGPSAQTAVSRAADQRERARAAVPCAVRRAITAAHRAHRSVRRNGPPARHVWSPDGHTACLGRRRQEMQGLPLPAGTVVHTGDSGSDLAGPRHQQRRDGLLPVQWRPKGSTRS